MFESALTIILTTTTNATTTLVIIAIRFVMVALTNFLESFYIGVIHVCLGIFILRG